MWPNPVWGWESNPMDNKTPPGLRKSQVVPLCVAGGPTGSGGHNGGVQNRGANKAQPFLTGKPSRSAFG